MSTTPLSVETRRQIRAALMKVRTMAFHAELDGEVKGQSQEKQILDRALDELAALDEVAA